MRPLRHLLNHRRVLVTLMLLCFVFTAVANAQCIFDTPTPVFIGTFQGFNHVHNGFLLNGGEGWCGAAPIISSACGSYNTANFNGYSVNRDKYQDIQVPANRTETHWQLGYDLTANDPHNDGWWTSLKAKVINLTDGGTIASQTWWGDDGALTCSPRSLSFQGNFAGKTLRVYFEGRNPTPNDTVIRVTGVVLYQSY